LCVHGWEPHFARPWQIWGVAAPFKQQLESGSLTFLATDNRSLATVLVCSCDPGRHASGISSARIQPRATA